MANSQEKRTYTDNATQLNYKRNRGKKKMGTILNHHKVRQYNSPN